MVLYGLTSPTDNGLAGLPLAVADSGFGNYSCTCYGDVIFFLIILCIKMMPYATVKIGECNM